MDIPLIFGSCRIEDSSSSKHKINKYGEIGSPWRADLWTSKYSDLYPFVKTQLLPSLYNVFIQPIKFSPKLNVFRVLKINENQTDGNVASLNL